MGRGCIAMISPQQRHLFPALNTTLLSPPHPTTSSPPTTMTTSLDALKQTGTVVVSDSGDFECECPQSVPADASRQD